MEAEERDEEQAVIDGKSSKSAKGDGVAKRGKNLKTKAETRPDPNAERVPIPAASSVITGAAAKPKGEAGAGKRGRPAKSVGFFFVASTVLYTCTLNICSK